MERRYRGIFEALCAFAIALAIVFSSVSAAQAAIPGRWRQRDNLRKLAVTMSNNSLRYLHTTWFSRNYAYSVIELGPEPEDSLGTTQTVEALVPPGGFLAGELPIRGQASALYATALALDTGYYSPAAVWVSNDEARRRTVAWTTGLAASYARDGWGCSWQSPLWVYYMGYGARRVWPSVPERTRQLVTSAVAAEADHLLLETPDHYRNAEGTVMHRGDSKSEEDAWRATLLLFAAREFPENPNAAAWENHGRLFLINAYAAPSQVGGIDPRITGSNINPDGTVTNHGRIHPDYMIAQAEFIAKIKLVAADTRTVAPPETLNNLDRVWNGLCRVRFSAKRFKKPGGTIYRWGKKKTQTAAMYYPQGTDWSVYRRFNAAQMDVEVFDASMDWRAYFWALQHLKYTIKQQNRYRDRHVFSRGASAYPIDEQFAAATAAEIATRLTEMR